VQQGLAVGASMEVVNEMLRLAFDAP
jgi:hypothetical protein